MIAEGFSSRVIKPGQTTTEVRVHAVILDIQLRIRHAGRSMVVQASPMQT